MKAFSPAGMAVKAFYGYGAKTFGNPSGATSGNGAVGGSTSARFGQPGFGLIDIPPPPPTPAPPPPITNVLTLTITADSTGGGQTLSGYLTAPQIANIQNGFYNKVVIQSNAVGPGTWWVVTGDAAFANAPGHDGFVIDVGPQNVGAPCLYEFDLGFLRFYGSGGGGGNQASNTPGHGGAAIVVDDPTAVSAMNVFLNMSAGGLVYGGGGGGGFAAPNNLGGGGGAGGWVGGGGADAGHAGGIFDSRNGGSGTLPPAAGSTAVGGTAGDLSPSGGNLASPGHSGVVNGAAGFAVRRVSAGVTTWAGRTGTNILGVVQ